MSPHLLDAEFSLVALGDVGFVRDFSWSPGIRL